jgi:hypothetical protein
MYTTCTVPTWYSLLLLLTMLHANRPPASSQLLYDMDAGAELAPSAINSTIAAAWSHGELMYCLSPYAGDSFDKYNEERSAWLQQLGKSVECGAVGLEQAVKCATDSHVDAFMEYATSMLINIHEMQSLVSTCCWRAVYLLLEHTLTIEL